MRSLQDLHGFKVHGKDGKIGSVRDFLFRDDSWVIAYIVLDTGKWLLGRKALISPAAIDSCHWVKKKFSVNLTRRQVKGGSDLDSEKPVSRQKERMLNRHYGLPMPALGAPPADMPGVHGLVPPPEPRNEFPGGENDSHLRSTREVTGYSIQARNGKIGHLEGFQIDDESWSIRYVIIGPGKCPPGKQVLVAPERVENISWQKEKVFVNLL